MFSGKRLWLQVDANCDGGRSRSKESGYVHASDRRARCESRLFEVKRRSIQEGGAGRRGGAEVVRARCWCYTRRPPVTRGGPVAWTLGPERATKPSRGDHDGQDLGQQSAGALCPVSSSRVLMVCLASPQQDAIQIAAVSYQRVFRYYKHQKQEQSGSTASLTQLMRRAPY